MKLFDICLYGVIAIVMALGLFSMSDEEYTKDGYVVECSHCMTLVCVDGETYEVNGYGYNFGDTVSVSFVNGDAINIKSN